MLAAIERRLRAVPQAERRDRLELVETLAGVALDLPLADLEPLKRGLDLLPRPRLDGDEWTAEDLAAARARNRVRVLEDRARLIAGSLPAATVARGLGVSRQRLHQYRRTGRLVAVPGRGPRGCLYPAWQFAADGGIVPGLDRVLAAAEEADMDAVVLHFVMVEPAERLGGEVPADLLAGGEIDRVVNLLLSAYPLD
jgi:hypothetical protein